MAYPWSRKKVRHDDGNVIERRSGGAAEAGADQTAIATRHKVLLQGGRRLDCPHTPARQPGASEADHGSENGIADYAVAGGN